MRYLLVGLCLVLMSWTMPARAQSCAACADFETLRIDGGSELFTEVLAKLKSRPDALVTLNSGAFCETGAGASVAADLVRAADDRFAQAKEIAEKIEQCPQTCAPKLSDAEFCAYGRRLVADRYRLGAVGLRLFELTHIYERAGQSAQLPIEVLSADLTTYGGEALDVLRRASSALAGGDPGALPGSKWDASATEIAGLFDAITLLADFSLIAGDTARIEMALDKSATEINTLRNDLHVAMNRTGTMQPSEQLAFERRILTGAAELAFAMASLQASATASRVDAGTEAPEGSSGDATGNELPEPIHSAIGCLNQLSRSAITGSEAPGLVDEMVSACRSFEDCSDEIPIYLPANISPLRAFLQSQAPARRQTLMLVESMCSAR